jgi:hypothetical protein
METLRKNTVVCSNDIFFLIWVQTQHDALSWMVVSYLVLYLENSWENKTGKPHLFLLPPTTLICLKTMVPFICSLILSSIWEYFDHTLSILAIQPTTIMFLASDGPRRKHGSHFPIQLKPFQSTNIVLGLCKSGLPSDRFLLSKY